MGTKTKTASLDGCTEEFWKEAQSPYTLRSNEQHQEVDSPLQPPGFKLERHLSGSKSQSEEAVKVQGNEEPLQPPRFESQNEPRQHLGKRGGKTKAPERKEECKGKTEGRKS